MYVRMIKRDASADSSKLRPVRGVYLEKST